MKDSSQVKRVLFVSDHLGYPDGVIHGATTYFLHVLPELCRSGITLEVCFLRDRHPAAEQLESVGIRPVFLDRDKWDARAWTDLKRIIRAHDLNLVHAAGMKGILMGRLAARCTGVRFLAHVHDTNPLDPVTRLLQRITAPWTDACLGISKTVCAYAEDMMGIDPKRIRLLYNGLPLSEYMDVSTRKTDTLRSLFRFDSSDLVVALIGRLASGKGHAAFIRGGAAWLHRHPSVRLLIVGSGPLETDLHHLVEELALAGQVFFAGHREDIPDLLGLASLVAMPSEREGFGYAALEAMAAGCPVVAFRVGGLAELIENERTGLLAAPGDMDAIWRHIERVLKDTDLAARLSQAGRDQAGRFSIEEHVRQLMAIYTSILDGTFKEHARS